MSSGFSDPPTAEQLSELARLLRPEPRGAQRKEFDDRIRAFVSWNRNFPPRREFFKELQESHRRALDAIQELESFFSPQGYARYLEYSRLDQEIKDRTQFIFKELWNIEEQAKIFDTGRFDKLIKIYAELLLKMKFDLEKRQPTIPHGRTMIERDRAARDLVKIYCETTASEFTLSHVGDDPTGPIWRFCNRACEMFFPRDFRKGLFDALHKIRDEERMKETNGAQQGEKSP